MAIPEGYEKLAVVGIAWKDEYTTGTVYKTMNGVYYQGSTYVALRDNPTGPPVADGANWQYLAKGFVAALLNMIDATDTSGVLGTAGAQVGAQDLMDAIADRVMTKLVAKNQIVNNLLATAPGNVLDATQGKALKDDITSLYSDLDEVNKYYANNLPYSNHLTSIGDIMSAIGTRNGKIYSEAGNAINPDQLHYFVLEIETYGEVIIATAKGSDGSIYTATSLSNVWSGWNAK